MPLGMTPNANWPTPSDEEFPTGIQFQLNGENLGGPDVTTFNIVAGTSGQPFSFTRGEGEEAGVLTLVIPVV